MKARPLRQEGDRYIPCQPHEATHLRMHVPGPISVRFLPVIIEGRREGAGCWSWNGDTEKPTLKPSILNDFRPNDPLVCHTFINDGKVIFLDDCSHELRGQTLDLLDIQ